MVTEKPALNHWMNSRSGRPSVSISRANSNALRCRIRSEFMNCSVPVGLVTVDDIARAYDFGASHPLRPERVLVTYEKIRTLGLIQDRVDEMPSRSASDEEITRVHDPEFVATVKAIDAGTLDPSGGLEFGLGTPDDPIFVGMHKASAA